MRTDPGETIDVPVVEPGCANGGNLPHCCDNGADNADCKFKVSLGIHFEWTSIIQFLPRLRERRSWSFLLYKWRRQCWMLRPFSRILATTKRILAPSTSIVSSHHSWQGFSKFYNWKTQKFDLNSLKLVVHTFTLLFVKTAYTTKTMSINLF